MKFTELNLHPKILQAIEVCGYTKPTPVQAQSIPNILAGKDIIASAQTGTGKTAAYVLPALQLLLTKKSSGKPRILILSPTRELANQITKVIGKYGKFAKINIASFIGGMPYHRQLREMSRPVDIIIATPGRLMDHMENKRLDLSHIEMLVIDEADRMLDMGFINDIKIIVQATPKKRQTLLLSATADDKLISIMKNLLNNPVKINISQEKIDTNLIKQKIHVVTDPNHKKLVLAQILEQETIFKAIIFSATKRNASKLAEQLREDGFAASPMHGDLKQSARNRTLAQFREGKIQFLVATDVAARGIDVLDITHVINYDLPKFSEDYVHRIGRTGRAGKTGIAISIALRNEINQLKKIERYIEDKIPMVHTTEYGEQEFLLHDEPTTNKRKHRSKQKNRPKHSNYRSNHNNRSDNHKHSEHQADGKKHGGRKFDNRKSPDHKFSDQKRNNRKFDNQKSDTSKPHDDKKSDARKHNNYRSGKNNNKHNHLAKPGTSHNKQYRNKKTGFKKRTKKNAF